MISKAQWRRFMDSPVVEWTIFVVGFLLMMLSPLAGVVPGPGGIIVFAIGLAMVLKTSMWAKRHYVRFKRWQPRAGRMTDWGLRRQSAKRRDALRKERDGAAAPSQGETLPLQGFEVSPIDPAPVELEPPRGEARR